MDKTTLALSGFALALIIASLIFVSGAVEVAHNFATLAWVFLLLAILFSVAEQEKAKRR